MSAELASIGHNLGTEMAGVAFGAILVWLCVRFHNRRERWAKQILLLLIALPALYVLSAGPTRIIAGRRRPIFQPVTGKPGVLAPSPIAFEVIERDWWRSIYSPVTSECEEWWASPLVWYIGSFPVLDPGASE